MDASPARRPTGPLAAAQSRAGRGPCRTAPPGPGPAWLAADQRTRAVLLGVQILSAAAQRGGWASYRMAGVPTFPPFRGLGVGIPNAQFGDGDVEKSLPIRFP